MENIPAGSRPHWLESDPRLGAKSTAESAAARASRQPWAPTRAPPHLPPPYSRNPSGSHNQTVICERQSIAPPRTSNPQVPSTSSRQQSPHPQPSGAGSGSSFTSFSTQDYLRLHSHPASASGANNEQQVAAPSGQLQAARGHQQLATGAAPSSRPASAGQPATPLRSSGGGGGGSKWCLNCVDISIKWYIVVIALAGLICALVGTIVGAVQSAGRDHISLTLLLIGVGLVLTAIGWIALKITTSTYKSNRRLAATDSSPFFLRPPAPSSSCARSAAAANLHRSLLNERIYMMAAAAAAAAAVSRQHQPAQPEVGGPARVEQPSGGLMCSIKQRLPRRLARLVPSQYSNLAPQVAGTSQAPEQPAASEQAGGSQNASAAAAASQAALAAFLHQYQAAMLGPHHPALLLPAPHPHLLGLPYPTGAEFPLRAPPPSYSAAMQDQRLRALAQQHQYPSANPPPPFALATPARPPAEEPPRPPASTVVNIIGVAGPESRRSDPPTVTTNDIYVPLESSAYATLRRPTSTQPPVERHLSRHQSRSSSTIVTIGLQSGAESAWR